MSTTQEQRRVRERRRRSACVKKSDHELKRRRALYVNELDLELGVYDLQLGRRNDVEMHFIFPIRALATHQGLI